MGCGRGEGQVGVTAGRVVPGAQPEVGHGKAGGAWSLWECSVGGWWSPTGVNVCFIPGPQI